MSKITTLICHFQRQPFTLHCGLSQTSHFLERYCSTKSNGGDDENSKDNHNLNKKETQNSMKDSKAKSEKENLSKKEKQEAKKKISSLLSEMTIILDSKTKAGENLRLARPAKRISKQERFKEQIQKHREMQKSPEDKLQDAAKVVATNVKGDVQQTLAKLNERLRQLNLTSGPQTPSKAGIGKILDEETSKNFMSSVKEIAATVADGSAPRSKLAERLFKISTEKKSSDFKRPYGDFAKGMKIEKQASEDRRRKEFESRDFPERGPRSSVDFAKGMKFEKQASEDRRRKEFESRDFPVRGPRSSVDFAKGMKIEKQASEDRRRKEFESRYFAERGQRSSVDFAKGMKIEKQASEDRRKEFESKDFPVRGPHSSMVPKARINILDAAPLNIFQMSEEPIKDAEKTVWQTLEEKNLRLLTQFAPANGFEEMIMWTEQGKHWKFPIDNQTELAGEENVGFHEHVFLEQHLHGFPTKGPIRHFMELVVVGLSKNPYISVERKIENIDWFREYFKEKEDILKATGALG